MLKKALAVLFCAVLAAALFAACGSKQDDETLRTEIVGVWVPVSYDLTTNDPFVAVMFTPTQHYLYSFGGGEIGARNIIMEKGTEYTIEKGKFVIETNTISEDKKKHTYKTAISFPDRNTMIWGEGANAETYRRMTDDEIAFFGLPLGHYNPDYAINEGHTSIPLTGGETTTGGSGSNNFDNAYESYMKPYIDYYTTWDYEKYPVTTVITAPPAK
ncbi:MAG: hypothetical protein LBL87_08195 [Ruminococcus sp.]|jgi:hypothetical protein|nr:hypothetical protein [Ruminococcus sp.]